MSAQQPEVETTLALTAPQSDFQQKSALLRPLNVSLIIFSAIGLALGVVRGSPSYSNGMIALSLLLNALVFSLARNNRTRLASHIFCLWINLGTLFFAADNLFRQENPESAIIFFCVLALSVILSGMLIGVFYSFVIVGVNSLVVISLWLYYYLRINPSESLAENLANMAAMAFPITVFLVMIAVISWLYQRALAHAALRLEAARQRILRDELLRRDLAVARELQQRLYPPPPLTNAALRIASRSEPARETSGDFYDFISLSDDRLGIVVADVTGKSIAAALVMAMSRSTLRSEATRHISPADVLHYANQTLCQDNTFKQMITAFYGVLDTRTLRLAISNAGHPFPVLRRDGRISELEICGLPLGARPDARYTEQVIQLQPGDQLVLISDGLLEEQNNRRELFGFDRMLATIANADLCDPEHALDEIWETVARFRDGSEQSDDITLVVVQVAAAATVGAAPSPLSAD
ncbi:SpoIIE family protein phosphatase [Oscillochloris sp. ZM17-4]|uniref:PP2C family protein-serine/threonine phosphatase n=1 Tax=Oscillochloris sp. ZM17-4 TaxID=2866714 RepID=UPI001C72AE0D|nr:SpoIIE family protein phosphatase [Oscillochloris sp. ZM17-4]MBX0328307.1 SpoIIE family protein phosphatase [Oscillochloris sp. ZM17-4]